MELFEHLGFNQNPFSTFSAEEEKSFLGNIYIQPRFFQTIKADIVSGHSRFILGARGIGKTALLLQLKESIESENVFTLIVDSFDGIPLKNNETELLRLVIKKVIRKLALEIGKDRKKLKRLNKFQKEKLSFFIKEFFETLSKKEYETVYNRADNYKTRNLLRNIWNYAFNRPVNFALSGGIELVAEAVRSGLGLPAIKNKDFYKNYIPELPIEQISKEINQDKFIQNYSALKSILSDITTIIKDIGYATTVVFFDKIDEYPKISGNVSAVAVFLSSLLKDMHVLMSDSYALVFSLWDVLKPDLSNAGVRFDKIKPVDITWTSDDLKNILEKRVKFFSAGKRSIVDIVPDASKLQDIISLSSFSPRYLFRQLSFIYDQQSELDITSITFSDSAIDKGQMTYCHSFDYYAIYPSKRGAKNDILRNINRLLKIGKTVIMTKDFVEVYKVGAQTAISYIKLVQDYNLVSEMPETDGAAKMYSITDPVIKFLINRNISEIRT